MMGDLSDSSSVEDWWGAVSGSSPEWSSTTSDSSSVSDWSHDSNSSQDSTEMSSSTSGIGTANSDSLMSSSSDDQSPLDTCSDTDDDWAEYADIQLPLDEPLAHRVRLNNQAVFFWLIKNDLGPSLGVLRNRAPAMRGRDVDDENNNVEEAAESDSGDGTGSSRFADAEESDDDDDDMEEEEKEERKKRATNASKGTARIAEPLVPSLVVSSDDGYRFHEAELLFGHNKYPVHYPHNQPNVEDYELECFPAPSLERALAMTQLGLTHVHKDPNTGCHYTSFLSLGKARPEVWSYKSPIMSPRKK